MQIEVSEKHIESLITLGEEKRRRLMDRIKLHCYECDIREFIDYTILVDSLRLQLKTLRNQAKVFPSDFYKSG